MRGGVKKGTSFNLQFTVLYFNHITILLYRTASLLHPVCCYAPPPPPPPLFRGKLLYRVILPPLHAPHPLRPLELVCGLRFMHIYACCKRVEEASVVSGPQTTIRLMRVRGKSSVIVITVLPRCYTPPFCDLLSGKRGGGGGVTTRTCAFASQLSPPPPFHEFAYSVVR